MKRDVSTSTIGREERKPLIDAYLFERRLLLGCSFLIALSLIFWIVAIATDHWIIISGLNGIFIPETRRFFLSSHSGLWKHCRYTSIPYALPNAQVARNFTSIGFQNLLLISDAKMSVAQSDYISQFMAKDVQLPLVNFTEEAKQRMFAHWVLGDDDLFKAFKQFYWSLVLSNSSYHLEPKHIEPILVNPLDIQSLSRDDVFGRALAHVVINSTWYYIAIPEPAQDAIFSGWNEKPKVPKLLWPYVRDLGLPAYIVNKGGYILQLIPPLPPKKGKTSQGYEYSSNVKCKYIEMFPAESSLRNDPGIDDELMDYIRTQASFACITVFVMSLGCVFSFYTFMNPRYMFKRLAGGIHLVSASTAIVVIQVLLSSVEYTRDHLFFAYPDGAELKYGYGVYLAWLTFSSNVFCGLMFMWYSGKKKGRKAPTDEVAMADEPTIMGR